MRYNLYKMRGEITVFLTLLFGIMSAFTLTVIESAEDQAFRIEVERNMLISLHSCFSEYNRFLFEEYEILAIDSSYRSETGDVDNVRKHLQEYAERNYWDEYVEALGTKILKGTVKEVTMGKYELLSDKGGEPLLDQINEVISDNQGDFDKSTTEKLKSAMNQRGNNDFMCGFAEALTLAECETDSPAEKIYEMAISGNILERIMDKDYSYKSVPTDRPSNRTLKKGSYLRQGAVDEDDEYCLNSYIVAYFSNCTKPMEDHNLVAETEYIISGKTRENDGISECAEWIMAQREIKNFEAMKNNEFVLAETERLADEITSTFRGNPYYVRLSLIYAWAYVESLIDVCNLYLGGDVDIYNGCESPKVSVDELLEYEKYIHVYFGDGVDYMSFLMGMLMNTDNKSKLYRCMDIIETNINLYDSPGFKVDESVTFFSAYMSIIGNNKREYEIEREFGY